MANIQYGGSGAGTLGWAAGKLFNQGVSGIQGAMDSYTGRVRNRAINDLLTQPSENMTADEYRDNMQMSLSGIDGIDPMKAIGLSNVASKSIYAKEALQREAEQQTYDRGVDSANLVMKADEATATAGYRGSVLTNQANRNNEISRHNKVMEVPNDIREATQAGYPSQMTRVRDDGRSDYRLSEEDFTRYQEDKSKASHSSRQLDPSTVDKNKAATFKIFDDAMFKALGEDGYKQFQAEKPDVKAKVYKYWQATQSLGYGMTEENTFSSDDYGVQDMPETDTTAVPDDIKYVGNQAFSADGSRAPQYDK